MTRFCADHRNHLQHHCASVSSPAGWPARPSANHQAPLS